MFSRGGIAKISRLSYNYYIIRQMGGAIFFIVSYVLVE